MNKEIKLIIDNDELWIVYNELGMKKKKPVGNFAVFTNKGIILQNGAILYDGTYISNEEDLPNVDDRFGEIRLFKEIIGNCKGQISLKPFEFNFNNILSKKKSKESWDDINNLLDRTFEGKTIILHKKFIIHSIVNLQRNGYGISLNDDKKKLLGNRGIVYSINNKSLILDINGKIILL